MEVQHHDQLIPSAVTDQLIQVAGWTDQLIQEEMAGKDRATTQMGRGRPRAGRLMGVEREGGWSTLAGSVLVLSMWRHSFPKTFLYLLK